MVKETGLFLLYGLFFGLLCVTQATAEVRLTMKTDKKTIVLGEPLTAELRVEDVREPISGINLDKLKKNFNVYGISGSAQQQRIQGRSINSETLTFTLYPLRTGKLQIPALSYRGKSSLALAVSVLESSEKMPRVIFKTAIDSAHPQVRQATTLTLDIYDDGTLQWAAPQELVAIGAHQRRLAESQHEELIEGKRYTVHRYAWALMPLREGSVKIEFPLLDAFKFGTRLRYPVPPLRLDAAPVPAYLPVHVPIGKPQVTVATLPSEIALDRPVNWMFTVRGNGISEEGIVRLLSSIRGNESLRFYPIQISSGDNGRSTSAVQTLRITLPFVPLQTGKLQLPEINLPYYDPVTARVESVLIPALSVAVFNPIWITVKKIVLGLVIFLAVGGLGYVLFNKIRLALQRRKSLLLISRAENAADLHRALLQFESENSVQNLTLQQWLMHIQKHYGGDEQLMVVVSKLEVARYAETHSAVNITLLAHDAVKVLKKLPLT